MIALKEITVSLCEKSYNIHIAPGLIDNSENLLKRKVEGKKCFIISDDNVFPLYGEKIRTLLENYDALEVGVFTFEAGEKNKTLSTVEEIYHSMCDFGMDRGSLVIALGGGVVGDIAGFAAATYMRGISFIQIPTTLLAMVDSSVGGKTGVDLPEGKNLVGAFWQPEMVLIDPVFLKTLTAREISGGMAEVVKYGLIMDSDFYENLNDRISELNNLDLAYYSEVIERCCSLKAEVVSKDEKESGIRAIFNLGHTFGHAIETLSGYGKYTHGEAVSIGMLVASKLSVELGNIDEAEIFKLKNLLAGLNLPIYADSIDHEQIYDTLLKDKKVKNGVIRYVLLKHIGKAEIVDNLSKEKVLESVKEFVGS